MSCSNNVRQLAISLLIHESSTKSLPAAASVDKVSGKPLLSWRVHLLPLLDEQDLYNQFKLNEPWDSPNNIKLLDKIAWRLACHQR